MLRVVFNVGHVRPPRLCGFLHFLFPNFAFFFLHATPLFFTLSDLARIIELLLHKRVSNYQSLCSS